MYVTSFGQIIRVSKRTYREFLECWARGEAADLLRVGGQAIGVVEANVTDITLDGARFLLESMA